MLMEEVSMEEFQGILSPFKMDKSLEPEGFPVVFYLGLFDVLAQDLLKVIEESRSKGKVFAVFNSSFIALIPNSDSLTCFEYFRPISL